MITKILQMDANYQIKLKTFQISQIQSNVTVRFVYLFLLIISMLKSFDFFRKLQTDQELTSATGGFFTLIAITLAVILGLYSFQDYYSKSYQTFLDLRDDHSQYLPMHLDIFFNKMPCNAITIQFFDELEYTQRDLQQKLSLSHFIPSNNQFLPYKREDDIEQQYIAMRNAIEGKYGCRVFGYLPLPKTPGTLVFKPTAFNNFIFTMQQETYQKMRMSYRIDTLQFGTANSTFDLPIAHKSKNIENYLKDLQGKLQKQSYVQDFTAQTRKLDYFNHLKIIPITVEQSDESSSKGRKEVQKYRYSLRNGLKEAQEPITALFFMTEIEPIHIVYRKRNPKLFNLVIQLLAIVGGTMATLGLINLASHNLFSIK